MAQGCAGLYLRLRRKEDRKRERRERKKERKEERETEKGRVGKELSNYPSFQFIGA
jgi:hypothetical protein